MSLIMCDLSHAVKVQSCPGFTKFFMNGVVFLLSQGRVKSMQVSRRDKQPQSSIFMPPCFTVVLFSLSCASPYVHPSVTAKKSLNFDSLVNRKLFQSSTVELWYFLAYLKCLASLTTEQVTVKHFRVTCSALLTNHNLMLREPFFD